MTEPLWVDKALLLQLHDEILAETGGAPGLRSEPLLESALARPINRFVYEGLEDLIELAATYAVAVSANHPFVDGNKRAAFICLGQFLADNGLGLEADADDATRIVLSVAAGEMGIPELAAWLRPLVTNLDP
jgi:death-on-curing protein